MDASILLRLGPALFVAWLVARRAALEHGLEGRETTDELLRFLVVGLVVGRAGFMLLEPAALGATLSIVVLVRAGVETGAAAVVVVGMAAWQWRRGRTWPVVVGVPAMLAGLAVWHGLCQVQGVCAGVPVSWGVAFPGRAFPAFPAGYVEATLLAVLAALAWRWRDRADRVVAVAASAAAARAGLGLVRPVLGDLPSRDQLWFGGLAVVLGVAARRLALAAPAVGDRS